MSQFAQIEATARAAAATVLQEALDRIDSLEKTVETLKDRLSPPASKAAPAAKGTTAQAGSARGSGKANG